jgi:hypothetical protein
MSISEMSDMIQAKKIKRRLTICRYCAQDLLYTPASNCSADRSFSVLRQLKNCLRSVISENGLNSLAIVSIESELTKLLTTQLPLTLLFSNLSRSCFEYSTNDSVTSKLQYHKRRLRTFNVIFKIEASRYKFKMHFVFNSGKNKKNIKLYALN